jgi:hypothetical protein
MCDRLQIGNDDAREPAGPQHTAKLSERQGHFECKQMLNAMSRPNSINRMIGYRREIRNTAHYVWFQAGVDINPNLFPLMEKRWKPRVIQRATPSVNEYAVCRLGRLLARHGQ